MLGALACWYGYSQYFNTQNYLTSQPIIAQVAETPIIKDYVPNSMKHVVRPVSWSKLPPIQNVTNSLAATFYPYKNQSLDVAMGNASNDVDGENHGVLPKNISTTVYFILIDPDTNEKIASISFKNKKGVTIYGLINVQTLAISPKYLSQETYL